MKLQRFPPENVHKRTGKSADKSHDRCRTRRSTTCYNWKSTKVSLRFSVACSLACREDVIFVRSMSYSCSFLIKMRFGQERSHATTEFTNPEKDCCTKKEASRGKMNKIFYVVMTWVFVGAVLRRHNWIMLTRDE